MWHTQHGEGLCVQCDSSTGRFTWLSDAVARRREPASGLDAERDRRSDHLEHGYRADDQRLDRRVRFRHHAIDPGHLQLLRTVGVGHSSTFSPRGGEKGGAQNIVIRSNRWTGCRWAEARLSRKGDSVGKLSLSKMVCIVFVVCAATVIASPAQTFATLVNFDGTNGNWPDLMSLVQGTDGNVNGTNVGGGANDNCSGGCGAVFSLGVGLGPTHVQFVNVTPCRVVDTRNANGTFGGPPIQGGTFRSFPIPQSTCNIPATAAAYSLNVTLVPDQGTPVGYLTIWPEGETNQPVVSTMNSLDGRVKANAAIVPAGVSGGVNVFVSNTTDVVLDIDGYFTLAGNSTLAFYALPPCRVADTRNPNGPLGGPYLTGGTPRDFPILQSQCGIPNSAQAYSFNFTAVPQNGNPLGYLTVWPAGQDQPLVSTLNAPTGTVVANAAIVPAGTGGDIDVFASNNSDLVIDVNGYFAVPGNGGLSLYPAVPCRVLDTRNGNGAFSGELTVDVVDSVCGPSNLAQAYVFNATVVPQGALGYLTLWPDGVQQPLVSTLNAIDGAVTSNMAIVPTNNGSIDAFASNLTQLILDISSYFAP